MIYVQLRCPLDIVFIATQNCTELFIGNELQVLPSSKVIRLIFSQANITGWRKQLDSVAGKINTRGEKSVLANRILTAVVNSGDSLLKVTENMLLERLLMMVQAVNDKRAFIRSLRDHAPLQMNAGFQALLA